MDLIEVGTKALVGIGALNWGLSIFNINLVSMLLGSSMLATGVYGAIGLSGAYVLGKLLKVIK